MADHLTIPLALDLTAVAVGAVQGAVLAGRLAHDRHIDVVGVVETDEHRPVAHLLRDPSPTRARPPAARALAAAWRLIGYEPTWWCWLGSLVGALVLSTLVVHRHRTWTLGRLKPAIEL